MKQQLKVGVLVMGTLVLPCILVSCDLNLDASTPVKKTSASSASSPAGNFDTLQKGPVSTTLTGAGQFLPTRTTSLYFLNVSGPLSQLKFKLNDQVNQGDLFAEVLSSDLPGRIAQQQIVVEKGRLRLAQLDNTQIEELKKSIELAQLDLVDLLKQQQNQPGMNDSALQKAQLALEQFQAQLNASRLAKQAAEANVQQAKEQQETEIEKFKLRLEQIDNEILSIKQSMEKEQADFEKLAGLTGNDKLIETEYKNLMIDKGNGLFIQLPGSTADLLKITKSRIEELRISLSNNEKSKQMAQLDLDTALARQNMPDYTIEQGSISLENIQKSIEAAQLAMDETSKTNSIKDDQLGLDVQRNKTKLEQLMLQLESAQKNKVNNEQQAALDQKSAELTLQQLQQNLKDSKLVSPVSGVVSFLDRKSVTDMVSSGSLLAKIADPGEVIFQLSAVDAKYVTDAKEALLTIGAQSYPVEVYKPQPGDVLEPAVDVKDASGNIISSIYVKFKGTIPSFKFGESLTVKLDVTKNDALLIPKSDIRVENGRILVDILKGQEIVTVEITRGIETANHVEVLSGLSAEDQIIHR